MILSFSVSGYFLFGPTNSITTLYGTITDRQSGWELAGASILITRGADLIGTITTDSKGKFQTEILPGTYTVEVSLIGYETAKIEGVEVRQGQVSCRPKTLCAWKNLSTTSITNTNSPLMEDHFPCRPNWQDAPGILNINCFPLPCKAAIWKPDNCRRPILYFW